MYNTQFSTITSFIEKHNLIKNDNTIIIGFSGGPDSLFLLHLLVQLRSIKHLKLITAHLDHEWRETSRDEVAFCQTIAGKLNVPFVTARISELAFDKKPSGSQEELGRRARRFFLETVRDKHNANSIALAHHLDDQEETFFIRLIRGSTIAGLACMKPRNDYYVRPLLEIRKYDILTYLENNGITYITDPSNISESHLRTRIRKHVIPALRQSDNRFDANFQRTLHHIQEADSFINIITKEIFSQTATLYENTWHINLTAFFKLHPFLQRRIIMHWLITDNVLFVPTESFLDEILRFLKQPGSKEHIIHIAWSIVKSKGSVYIKHTQ